VKHNNIIINFPIRLGVLPFTREWPIVYLFPKKKGGGGEVYLLNGFSGHTLGCLLAFS